MNYKMNYFRILGYVEGLSLLALFFIAMPAKRIYGYPQAVTQVGSIHGILFVMYVYTLVTLAREEKWTFKKFFIAFILASVPFGTFYFDRKYLN